VARRFQPRVPQGQGPTLPEKPGEMRPLLEKLKALNSDELTQKTKDYLTKDEVKGVMARRGKIVATFQNLIAQKGEKEVLY
jgi:hypothetical protein